MVYGELGEKELKYTVWKRMASFWKKLTNEGNSLAGLIYQMINNNDHEHKWMLGVKNITVNCGIPVVKTYIKFVSDFEFKKYIKRKCEDLRLCSRLPSRVEWKFCLRVGKARIPGRAVTIV